MTAFLILSHSRVVNSELVQDIVLTISSGREVDQDQGFH